MALRYFSVELESPVESHAFAPSRVTAVPAHANNSILWPPVGLIAGRTDIEKQLKIAHRQSALYFLRDQVYPTHTFNLLLLERQTPCGHACQHGGDPFSQLHLRLTTVCQPSSPARDTDGLRQGDIGADGLGKL